MPKTSSRAPQTSDTKEARLVAAQSFIKGDRVRHQVTGKIGVFDSINLGFALPEVWVQFETDTEFRVPISCNPLELELVERGNDSTQFSVASVTSTACATEEREEQDLSTSSMSPSSLSCIPNDERSSPDTTHTSQGITTSETSVQSEESSMSSAVGLHARETVELTPTKEDEIWNAPASGSKCSDLSTTAERPDAWTDIPSPDGGQLTLPLATSASTNVVSPTAQSDLHPLETPFHPNNQQSKGDESDISPDCFRPGMRVWSERTITTKDKPDQVIRMTGMVVRTTSRQIVPDQTSDVPVDTPLVEVQWDGVKSIVLLSPGELHMETSSDQVTTDTSALASQDVIVPEVIEELTESEALERRRLEFTVERAFYEAGAGLRVLREKRLYRSTHHTFEEYCRDRFGFSRQNVNYLIAASTVVENILTTIGCQNSETSNYQILPTSERQVRPLTALEANEQRQIWQEAVEQSGGKVPSGRIVKGIVERLKE